MKKEYLYSDEARKDRSNRKKGNKGNQGNKGKGSKPSHNQNNAPQHNNGGEMHLPPSDFEVVFKWVPIEAVRVPGRPIYEEYVLPENRDRMLRETVYNPDGTENKEGIERLRQAGLSERDIFETIGRDGHTPNGFNYHHLYPRAVSGALNEGPVEFGGETLTSIHDWRCMMVLPCKPPFHNVHDQLHKAIDERNGPIPEQAGMRGTYYVPIALTAEEYELYKTNPKALKEELLIVSSRGYRTEDQRDEEVKREQPRRGKTEWRRTKKPEKSLETADIAKMKAARNGR
ncbi:MAG: hypothetical protein J5787_01165 [Alphaproteobacteria bacterium]|nr:hypothetical protein [Alphaproteobacteria bacterium]MBO4644117.1 hypothetical protein [Alphaproteobacteria bacterium]